MAYPGYVKILQNLDFQYIMQKFDIIFNKSIPNFGIFLR